MEPSRTSATQFQYGELNASNVTVASNGRFPIRIENALNHVQYIQYDERFGVPRRVQDPNSFNTQSTYDEYGRVVHQQRSGFPSADFYRGWCTAATCANSGKLKTVTVVQGAPVTATEIDFLGRETAQLQTSFGGKTVVARTKYTNRGEIDMVSRPYYFDALTTDIRWSDYSYDAISRVVSETEPGETGLVTTTTNYSPGVVDQYAFEVTITNALNQVTKKRYHVRGLLDRAYTAFGASEQSDTKFTYDVFGNVLTTQVNGNSATTVTHTYDIRGRERTLRDPDLAPNNGVWTFDYFSNGDEIYRQTDAKNQVATFTYDLLGRMTQRVEPEGTTNFTFDPTNGKGMLSSTTAPEGENESYSFDTFGRHSGTTTTVTGTGAGSGTYQRTFGFDSIGRMTDITYPATTGPTLTVRYDFNANGYVRQVKNLSSGAAYWTLDATTAEGQIKNVTFGNGINTENRYQTQTSTIDEIRTGPANGTSVQFLQYDFDTIGNLTRRVDANQNISERMTAAGAYDAQNRLKTVERLTGTTVAQTSSMTYDTLGNVVTKSSITGTYNYTQTPQTSCPTGYTTSPGPHALRRTGTTTSNYRHYCYDKNGNQTRGWNFTQARQRTATWNSYNMPSAITEAGVSTTFSYGADRQRFRQVNGFNSNETTIYIDNLFDRSVVGATTTDLHYVLAYGQAVAVFSSRSDGVTSTRYLHRDHLGSVSHVTDSNGVVADTFSYDAWGKRRNATGWTDIAGQPSVPSLRRPAYTDQENLQEVSLVHMNGRVYDPNVSHMLSADPFVQFPGDGQSYNRYSYVRNNPLRYTDPSGFCLRGNTGPRTDSLCGNPLSGLLGRGSSQPAYGVTQTVDMATGRWGFNVSGGFNAGGGYCNGPGIADCTGAAQTGINVGVEQAAWDVSALYTVTYAGLIAGDSGESSGGAMAAQALAGYEQRVLATITDGLPAKRRHGNKAESPAVAAQNIENEEQVLKAVIALARAGRLGFDVPEGWTYTYSPKMVACMRGPSSNGCFARTDITDPDDENRAWAITSQSGNHTDFFGGSATAETIALPFVRPSEPDSPIFTPPTMMNAYEKAAYVIGHEVNGHLVHDLNGNPEQELLANYYGREAIRAYRANKERE
jgi:RHS repeat-associated protein